MSSCGLISSFVMTNQEYLESIKKKLDAMNKEAGIDPSKKGAAKKSPYEPDLMDPFHAQGLAAIKYMEEQKRKSKGK